MAMEKKSLFLAQVSDSRAKESCSFISCGTGKT
jgi:hypothetical protein